MRNGSVKIPKIIEDIPLSRRIYVDECGVIQNQSRTHGRSVKGQRVYGLIPGKRSARINVVAGYCDGQILADICFTGSMNACRFGNWFCTHLLPLTKPGDVVILDNASYRRKKHLILILD